MERQALESQLPISKHPWSPCTVATTRMAAPFDMSALSNILNVRAARVAETASALRHTSLDLACL